MSFKGSSRIGVLHRYTPQLTAFEHTPNPSSEPHDLLIFVGGLFGGLLTTAYTTTISDSLPSTWSLAEVLLSSSYTGWGTSSLSRDVDELSKCVSYFRTFKTGRIVLMGHSTGCQDVMEYLTGLGHEARPAIDGGIIQAPASDRESMELFLSAEVSSEASRQAKLMVDSGNGDEILPSKARNGFLAPAPVSARRWLSLASPDHDGDDDYFSSDLSDEQLLKSFGALPTGSPLCILVSGSDEYMPNHIDKEALLKRWVDVVNRGDGKVDSHSGVIAGATHDLTNNPKEIVDVLVKSVLGFLAGLR